MGILIDEISFILEHSEILAKTKRLIKILKKYFILSYELMADTETRELIWRTVTKKTRNLLNTIEGEAKETSKKRKKHYKNREKIC